MGNQKTLYGHIRQLQWRPVEVKELNKMNGELTRTTSRHLKGFVILSTEFTHKKGNANGLIIENYKCEGRSFRKTRH